MSGLSLFVIFPPLVEPSANDAQIIINMLYNTQYCLRKQIQRKYSKLHSNSLQAHMIKFIVHVINPFSPLKAHNHLPSDR